MQAPRAVIAFDEGGSREALVFPDLTFASAWMEDVDDGEYGETAWLDDGEVAHINVEEATRGDRRVRLTSTGRHDVPELRRRLLRTHPELAEADIDALQALAATHLTAERAWRESRGFDVSCGGCASGGGADPARLRTPLRISHSSRAQSVAAPPPTASVTMRN